MYMDMMNIAYETVYYICTVFTTNKNRAAVCLLTILKNELNSHFSLKKKYNIIMPNREQTPRHVHIYL